jgi:hypothetical protein
MTMIQTILQTTVAKYVGIMVTPEEAVFGTMVVMRGLVHTHVIATLMGDLAETRAIRARIISAKAVSAPIQTTELAPNAQKTNALLEREDV